jgi:hypothetical protein
MQASIPKGNKYGLSDEEVEIARRSITNRPNMRDPVTGAPAAPLSHDDMERIYSENKQKFQRMRASGEYSDRT